LRGSASKNAIGPSGVRVGVAVAVTVADREGVAVNVGRMHVAVTVAVAVGTDDAVAVGGAVAIATIRVAVWSATGVGEAVGVTGPLSESPQAAMDATNAKSRSTGWDLRRGLRRAGTIRAALSAAPN
jgi:hypothetical protein